MPALAIKKETSGSFEHRYARQLPKDPLLLEYIRFRWRWGVADHTRNLEIATLQRFLKWCKGNGIAPLEMTESQGVEYAEWEYFVRGNRSRLRLVITQVMLFYRWARATERMDCERFYNPFAHVDWRERLELWNTMREDAQLVADGVTEKQFEKVEAERARKNAEREKTRAKFGAARFKKRQA